MGIDIDLIETLIAGEAHQEFFQQMVSHYRRSRKTQRLNAAKRLTGSARVEVQARIEKEYSEGDGL